MPDTLAEISESLKRIERVTAKTAETVGILDERQKVMRDEMVELKDHQKEGNGHMAAIMADQHEMKGAVSMLKWFVGAMTAGIGAGAALAGGVLAVVGRG